MIRNFCRVERPTPQRAPPCMEAVSGSALHCPPERLLAVLVWEDRHHHHAAHSFFFVQASPHPPMATVATHLLVSQSDNPEAVRAHAAIEAHGFAVQVPDESSSSTSQALQFSVTQALDEHERLDAPARELSAAFPSAIVTVYELEERFDQIERVWSAVFVGGEQVGELTHGSVFHSGL